MSLFWVLREPTYPPTASMQPFKHYSTTFRQIAAGRNLNDMAAINRTVSKDLPTGPDKAQIPDAKFQQAGRPGHHKWTHVHPRHNLIEAQWRCTCCAPMYRGSSRMCGLLQPTSTTMGSNRRGWTPPRQWTIDLPTPRRQCHSDFLRQDCRCHAPCQAFDDRLMCVSVSVRGCLNSAARDYLQDCRKQISGIFTYWDAEPVCSQVSQPKDPFSISDDDNLHLILWPIAHQVAHVALASSKAFIQT